MKLAAASLALITLLAAAGPAFGWGAAGHRMTGVAAMRGLPAEVPAFLRRPQAVDDVGELSREPDRSKDSGKIHDSDRDPGHFIDLDDEGKILGGPPMAALPPTRADYEKALQAAGTDSWKAGYLYYSIVDRQQQLTTDFAYWRVLAHAERNPAWRKHRAWFRADRIRREAQILQTIGQLSHFVGDGSQPLHVTMHYNGWGAYPNPRGYTTARIHGPFEGQFVLDAVRPADVAAAMAPFRSCGCPIEERATAYLLATGAQVEPLYALEKAGGLASGDPRGAAFATRQIAIGASELRDLVVEAWRSSLKSKVGWSPVAVADVLAGKADPYPSLVGVD
jgi:hypothetical protein